MLLLSRAPGFYMHDNSFSLDKNKDSNSDDSIIPPRNKVRNLLLHVSKLKLFDLIILDQISIEFNLVKFMEFGKSPSFFDN